MAFTFPKPPDEAQKLDTRLAELQQGIDRFDADLAAWLETPSGRFAQWLAERGR